MCLPRQLRKSQITKLYDQNFWKQLYKTSTVDEVKGKLIDLLKEAIERKIRFDPKQKEKIILLIDTWPGITPKLIEEAKVKLVSILSGAGFKEIWLVGREKEQIVKIST